MILAARTATTAASIRADTSFRQAVAFAETGDKDKFYRHGSAKDLGVGSGAVFSIQYQF